jgi:alkaline phosphatase D
MFSRRLLMGGLAGLVLPGRLPAAPLAGFTHGVASGEPTMDSVLLWTRFVGAGDAPVPLAVDVALAPDMARPIASAQAIASRAADWTARAIITGLPAGRWLWYRWRGPGDTVSPLGRTRTLPDGGTLAIALFSCSNIGFGWFNAYGHAAARDDLHLAVHLGDYLYEYPRGTYPGPADAVAGRMVHPAGALRALGDYRARYASYRRCPDLRALHARLPMLCVWDDHEFADNARRDGAYNHDPAREGHWADRTAAALQAWAEWLPVSGPNRWDVRAAGDLAGLIRLETRITGRTPGPDLYVAARTGTPWPQFVADDWQSPRHLMIGADQEAWLAATLATAARSTRWQILLQSVPMGHAVLPPAALDWPVAGGRNGAAEVAMLVAAGRRGIPYNMDNWGGFPAQRARLLAAAAHAGARLIVTSGDSHNGWGHRMHYAGQPVAVELAAPSVTAPGFERWFPGTDPDRIAAAMVAANPELMLADTSRRGYGCLHITADHVRMAWHYPPPPAKRQTGPALMVERVVESDLAVTAP